MLRFINGITGCEMWVADDRKDEYLAAGHRLAAGITKTEEKPIEKPARKRSKEK